MKILQIAHQKMCRYIIFLAYYRKVDIKFCRQFYKYNTKGGKTSLAQSIRIHVILRMTMTVVIDSIHIRHYKRAAVIENFLLNKIT